MKNIMKKITSNNEASSIIYAAAYQVGDTRNLCQYTVLFRKFEYSMTSSLRAT